MSDILPDQNDVEGYEEETLETDTSVYESLPDQNDQEKVHIDIPEDIPDMVSLLT